MDIIAGSENDRFFFAATPFNEGWTWDYNEDGSLNICVNPGGGLLSITCAEGMYLEIDDEAGTTVKTIFPSTLGDLVSLQEGNYALKKVVAPDPKLSDAEIETARGTVTETIFNDLPYEIPDKLAGCIEWFQGKLQEVPEELRDTAEVSFDTRTEYGETYDNVCITYERPETDAEVVQRVKIERQRKDIEEAKRKAVFDHLKAEFG